MILIGASGHCKVIVDILRRTGVHIDNIFDANPIVQDIFGISVVKDLAAGNCAGETKALITIGNNSIRKKLAETIDLTYTTAIHPQSSVSQLTQIGVGTVVMAHATVNPCASIGQHCIINTGAVVEHDCVLGNFVHVSPNAALGGNVVVGEGTHIGIGASVIQGITIGNWATVGAGAVVIQDIPDFATAVGNPARIIKSER